MEYAEDDSGWDSICLSIAVAPLLSVVPQSPSPTTVSYSVMVGSASIKFVRARVMISVNCFGSTI